MVFSSVLSVPVWLCSVNCSSGVQSHCDAMVFSCVFSWFSFLLLIVHLCLRPRERLKFLFDGILCVFVCNKEISFNIVLVSPYPEYFILVLNISTRLCLHCSIVVLVDLTRLIYCYNVFLETCTHLWGSV